MKQEWKDKIKLAGKKTGIAVLATALFFICAGVLYLSRSTWALQEPLSEEPLREDVLSGGTAAGGAQSGSQGVGAQDEADEYWNIAVFGVDSRRGDAGKGTNADTQLICSVNKTTGEVRLVSVYRDTFLKRGTEYAKINLAYAQGGPLENVKALNENLDLDITDYVTFTFKSAADLINGLGGIDLEITEPEWEYINAFITETVDVTGVPSSHLDGPGMQHLDGVQAVAYARLRLMDTDMERTKRQQKVVGLVWEKLKAENSASDILGILTDVMPQLSTSIGLEDIMKFLIDTETVRIVDTAGFPFDYTEAAVGNRGSCVIPATLESNVVRLHAFLYGEEDYACPDAVKAIDREILKQAVKN